MATYRYTFRAADGSLKHFLHNPDKGTLVGEDCPSILGTPVKNYTQKAGVLSKDFEVEQFTILVGLNCNYNCTYCIQQKVSQDQTVTNFTPNKIDTFLQYLSHIDTSSVKYVMFWGGETLLYWKTIVQLVPKLREMIPSLEGFLLATNGALLTEEKLEYCVANNIKVQISDDGDNTLRTEKAVKNQQTLRHLIRSFCERHPDYKVRNHGVIPPSNPDIFQTLKTLKEAYNTNTKTLVSTFVPMWPVREHTIEQMKEVYTEWTFDRIILLHDSLYKCLSRTGGIWDATHRKGKKVSDIYHEVLTNFFAPNVVEENRYGCHVNRKEFTIDCDGNVYFCRESPYKQDIICTAEEFNDTFVERVLANQTFTPRSKKTTCRKCPIKHVCFYGGCSAYDDEKTRIFCVVKFAYAIAKLRATFKVLKNYDLVDIELVSGDGFLTNEMKEIVRHQPNYRQSKAAVNKVIPIQSMS